MIEWGRKVYSFSCRRVLAEPSRFGYRALDVPTKLAEGGFYVPCLFRLRRWGITTKLFGGLFIGVMASDEQVLWNRATNTTSTTEK